MRRILLTFCTLMFLASSLPAQAQKKQLTPELIESRQLVRPGILHIQWRPRHDQVSYVRLANGRGGPANLEIYDVQSGQQRTVIASGQGREGLRLPSYQWSPHGDSLLVAGSKALWLINAETGAKRKVVDGAVEYPTFSPAGDRIAYVKGNNIFAQELQSGAVTQLTSDGNTNVMNGKLDWVYEEELANRAGAPAYEWSPDSQHIAYLRLDDTPVPQYPLTHYLSTHVELVHQRFPQAGDPNPAASFHVVTVANFPKNQAVSLNDKTVEYYGPAFTWTPDSKAVAFLTLDRLQNREQVRLWNPATGTDRVLLTERDPYWINSLDPPYFLKNNGGFLWLSERDGWLHLYRYAMGGRLMRKLTAGHWMIDHPIFSDTPMFQVDEAAGLVYFVSTNPDPRERQLYRVRLADGTMNRLSTDAGTHSLNLSPDGRYLIDTYSNVDTAPEVRLLKADGARAATLDKGANHLGDYALGRTELVQLKAHDGTTLDARIVKPPDFDPNHKYPVIVDVYGGPHVQLIQNRWGVTGLLDQLLAEQGFIIWSLDNRGSWGRGHAWESVIYEHMGKHELDDQLAGIEYLKSLPYIDPHRIGIHGWSYGGYMTLYALTHAPDVFKCGSAGGPVTAWKFYDSIYTERYMRTPQENPAGYRDSSPLYSAGRLKAKVLLIHGTDDDNVHMQNTMNFVEALVKARLPFELYLQPGERHGFASPASRVYRDERELRFFKENL